MFRTLSKSKMGFVLAILFVISLFFFRSGSRESSMFNSDTVVATVSGTPITTSKFNRTMQMNVNKFKQVLGKELNGDEIRSFNIHNLALNALISNAIFENEYDKINFKIDEVVIAQNTKERIPQLYDSNNKLNELYLKSFLNQQKLQIEDIVQIINFETRDLYFKESFFNVNYPYAFTRKINNFKNHKRNISYFEFDIKNISIKDLMKSNTSEGNIIELEKYYNKNESNYMTEEKRDVEFFVIDKELYNNNFIPTKFEIEEYYNNNKQLFFEDEKRSFLQFNFKNKNEAIDFKNVIKKFSTNKVIEYASQNNIRFNKFENLKSDEILENLSKSLFNLELNQKSEVIETSLANHILILQSVKKSNQLKLEKIKDKIISTIVDIDSNNFYIDLVNKVSNKILAGEGIGILASDFNLKIQKIDNLTVSSQNTSEVNQIVFSDLIEKSFTSNKDFVNDVISLDNNLAYVYNVIDIKKSIPIPLNSIIKKVFIDWKYLKRSEKIKSEIDSNKNSLSYFENLAKNVNAEINKITITKNYNELPYQLTNYIFEGDLNNSFQYINDDRAYIARVNDVIIEDIAENTDSISLEDNLKNSFGEILMKKKKIKFNEALITALIERY